MISVEDKAIALLDHLVQTANGETNFRLHCLWCALPTSILLLQIGQTHTAIAAHPALVVHTCVQASHKYEFALFLVQTNITDIIHDASLTQQQQHQC